MRQIVISCIGSRDFGDPGKHSARIIPANTYLKRMHVQRKFLLPDTAILGHYFRLPKLKMLILSDMAGFHSPFIRYRHIVLLTCLLLLVGCSHTVRPARQHPPSARIANHTGINACDNYLDTYLACHRAAGIYSPDVLQLHYQAIRDTLLREAADLRVRPYLSERCIGLAQQMDAALQGHPCAPKKAAAPVSH